MSERIDYIYTDNEDEALELLNGGSVTSASGETITMGGEDFVLVPDDSASLVDIEEAVAALEEEIPTDYVDLSNSQTVSGTKTFDTTILLPNAPTAPEEWTNTDTYTQRVTGKGEQEIVDGSSAEINEIKGSTVRCENLFDINSVELTGCNISDGSIVTTATTWYIDMLLSSGTYTFSLLESSIDIYIVNGKVSSGNILATLSKGTTSVKFTYDASVDGYLRIKGFGSEITLSNIQIALGDKTEYQPYFTDLKHSYFKGVKSTGRNLIPFPESFTWTGTVMGQYSVDLSAGTYIISCESSTTEGAKSTPILLLVDSINNKTISFSLKNKKITFTTTVDGTYDIRFYSDTGYNNSQGYSATVNELRLNIGSTAQPFEPYVEDTYELPQTLELGKYDSFNPQTGEITRATNRIVFTGNERFTLQSINANGFANFVTASSLNDSYTGDNPEYIICNQYEWDSNLIADVTKNGVFHNTSRYLFFRDNRYTTLDEWEAHLAELYAAGTPLTVEYKLATPTIETIVNAPKSYTAYNQGTETIIQGETDNSVYGAIPTITTTYKIHENPTEVANKAYVNNGLAKKLDKTGGTITGNLIVENGTTTTLPVLVVKNNEHTFGLALEDDTYKLGTGKVEDGVFTFDEGEGRPVALRDDSENFENEAIPVWNSEGNYFKSSGKTIDDIPQITVDGVAAKTLKIYVSADGYLCIDTE